MLQLVHRPSVRQVMQSLYKRNLLPLEHSVAKIKRNFTLGVCGGNGNQANSGLHVSSVNGSGLNDVTNNINSKCVRISLKCPIIKSRIRLPARGLECKHVQCFDLEGYLMMNCERGTWRCPECSKPALTESLEIDQYYWAILNTLTNADVDEVIIDSSANWRAVQSNNNNILLSPSANGNNNNPSTNNNPNSNNSGSSGPVRPTNSAISSNNNASNTLDVAVAGSGVVAANASTTSNNNSVSSGTGNAALGSLKKENTFSDDITKVMSPGSTQLPTWDSTQSMSPFSSHDMNSIANGNLMSGTSNNITSNNNQL